MALTPQQQLSDVENIMEHMQTDHLQEIINHANTIIGRRTEQYRNELWSNVVAAMKKYESEIGEITVRGDHVNTNCYANMSSPGTLFLYN